VKPAPLATRHSELRNIPSKYLAGRAAVVTS
jgi:hypothetical protein